MAKSRVAIVNTVYKYGSTGRICFEMASYFLQHDIDARVYFGRGVEQNDGIGHLFSGKFSVFTHALFARLFDVDSKMSFYSTTKLIKFLSDFKPDTIILNNLHGYYINLEKLISYINFNNIRTILILHDCWPFTGHCAQFEYIGCEKYKTGCYSCPNRREYPSSILIDNSKFNYLYKRNLFLSIKKLTIISPSQWMKKTVSESFFKNTKIVVVNNGIDTAIFNKGKSDFRNIRNLNNKKLILCIASVWNTKKGIRDIIDMSFKLKNDEKIVLVGRLKTKIKLNDNIIHVKGTNSTKDLADIYRSCDVLFNPTYEDTFSNVNMEALSCGLPVVCYKTGGAFEMVDKRFVVEKGNFFRAYEIIEKIFNKEIAYDFTSGWDFDKKYTYARYLSLIDE